MAKSYRSRVLGNWGIDNLDAEHAAPEAYAVIAKDMIVSPGKIESRSGLTLWNTLGAYIPAYLTGGTSATTVLGTWTPVTDGSFTITIDGTSRDVTSCNFSGDATMGDVADTIQARIRAITSSTETCIWVNDHFVISSVLTTASSAITVTSAQGGGTDVSGAGATAFMDAETGRGTVTATAVESRTGGITSMTPAYFRGGVKQLIFSNDDDWYYLENTSSTTDAWNWIGDYGTTTTNPSSFFSRNTIAMGTGIEANTPRIWTGSSYLDETTRADTTSDTRFFEYHQAKSIAYTYSAGNPRDNANHNNSILYYTTDLDDWSTGGTINIGTNDGQEITGMKSHGNLLVYKDNSKYKLDVVYESSAGVNILRVLEDYHDGGAVNNEVIQVVLNDIISLSGRPGDGIRGFAQTQTQLGGSESRRFSTKLKPYLDLINWRVVKQTARSIVWDEKYFLSLPISSAVTNNIVLVGHLDQVTDIGEIPWTVFDMSIGSFGIFQDTNGVEQLLMGDADNPKIYKWDKDSLSDNQTNISPQFRTKRFDLGDIGIDDLHTVVVAGQMTEPTELKCKVFADGKSETFVIKKEQLINTTDYIWSHVVGSEVVGGNATSASKPRYLAILSIPDALRLTSELQFDFSYSGQGMYFSVDYLSVNESLNYNKFADTHNVSAET